MAYIVTTLIYGAFSFMQIVCVFPVSQQQRYN
jgi:hypothetical protein